LEVILALPHPVRIGTRKPATVIGKERAKTSGQVGESEPGAKTEAPPVWPVKVAEPITSPADVYEKVIDDQIDIPAD
jgi:hypothetical protein